jgi:hypothetical protein
LALCDGDIVEEDAELHPHEASVCTSRQIECFDGRIDKSATFYPDKKMHHVVNFYYDKNGTEVKREGHVWNFHSWNDVWVRRDKHHYSGYAT